MDFHLLLSEYCSAQSFFYLIVVPALLAEHLKFMAIIKEGRAANKSPH